MWSHPKLTLSIYQPTPLSAIHFLSTNQRSPFCLEIWILSLWLSKTRYALFLSLTSTLGLDSYTLCGGGCGSLSLSGTNQREQKKTKKRENTLWNDMPHKVALIPVQSARLDTDFVYQTTLRSIGAYATQRRHQKWHESIEYAILTPDGQRPNFNPFQQVDQLRLAIKDLKEQRKKIFIP